MTSGPGASSPGKYALYSAAEKRPFTCTVECSVCREETRVNYLELATLMLPVAIHMPLVKRFHSWFRCPACGDRTWQRIHLDR